jgi:2-succinyl-6-hydroxy-2,4-cyclohexadiene-1-carboxylate synthase
VTRLVLVPGFTQTTASWDDVVAGLHPSIEVCPATVPVRGSFEATADAIVEEAGDAVYCGYSMGGRLCLRLALDHPDAVRSLVLVSATAGIEDAGSRRARVESDEELAEYAEAHGVSEFLLRWMAQPMFRHVPSGAAGLAERRELTPGYVAHCLRVLGTGAMAPMWSRLDELKMPVTVVTGGDDDKFTEIGARLPGEHIVVAGCGHAVPLEAPNALAAVLNDVCT